MSGSRVTNGKTPWMVRDTWRCRAFACVWALGRGVARWAVLVTCARFSYACAVAVLCLGWAGLMAEVEALHAAGALLLPSRPPEQPQ